eukprot:9474962-Pyramimonas_sp.AAC.1
MGERAMGARGATRCARGIGGGALEGRGSLQMPSLLLTHRRHASTIAPVMRPSPARRSRDAAPLAMSAGEARWH